MTSFVTVSLGREKKRVDKQLESERAAAAAASAISPEDLRAALAQVNSEEFPKNPADGESFFTTNVSIGEQFATQGMDECLSCHTLSQCSYICRSEFPPPRCPVLLQSPSRVSSTCRTPCNLPADSPRSNIPGMRIHRSLFGTPLIQFFCLVQIILKLTDMDVSEDISFAPETNSHISDDESGSGSPTRTGPPSETSSQDWDKLIDTGSGSFLGAH